jgi:hypothetical protein
MSAVAVAGPPNAPPLPAPVGRAIMVATEPELRSAVRSLTSNTTILIAPGTYRLTETLGVSGPLRNISIRGASGQRDEVVIVGPGMQSDSPPRSGIWSGGGVDGLTVADLTLREFPQHAIILNAGTRAPRLYNLRLADTGQQIVKSNPDDRGSGVDDGVVEYSIVEYTTTSPGSYTNGVDVLAGRRWTIRHNLFRNIRAPRGQLAGPALLMWRGAADTTVEGNTFANCQRAIAFGLEARRPYDHSGGVIRNNVIYRRPGETGDVGIILSASPGTLVSHNTVLLSRTYHAAIEYRFSQTTGARIVNNLMDAPALRRDGAIAAVIANVTAATPLFFVDIAAGDFRLRDSARAAIDSGIHLAEVPDDWSGHRRDARPDVGAHEWSVPARRHRVTSGATNHPSNASAAKAPAIASSLARFNATTLCGTNARGRPKCTSVGPAGACSRPSANRVDWYMKP